MTTIATVRPTDLRSLREAVLDTAGPIGIGGAGTAAGWAGALGPVQTALDVTGLTGVIAHNPGDMTVSVRAGTPMRALVEELREHGQHVSLDAARIAEGATVGGLVATGDAGPSALVYGMLRDLVIGVTVVLADGTVARSGGHVIKNVAGYDLAKLLHGSYGTLGVLAEIVLRLHPVPRRTTTVTVECDLPEAAALATRVLDGPLEPAACEWVTPGLLLIRLDGTQDALPTRTARLRAGLEVPAEAESTPDGPDPWERHSRVVRTAQDMAVLRIGAKPGVLPGLLAELPATAVAAGLGTGIATVALPAEPDVVADAHRAVHAVGGTSVLRSRPAGLDAPAWGPPPSALAVLRAVKTALDPDNRLGPGRFAPWM